MEMSCGYGFEGGFTLNHKPARFSGWERGKGLLVHKPGSVVIEGEFGGG